MWRCDRGYEMNDELDAKRYRWLRQQFELQSEENKWEEFVGENKDGQLLYEARKQTFYHFCLKDEWRFGTHVKDDGEPPSFDDLIDAEMSNQAPQ